MQNRSGKAAPPSKPGALPSNPADMHSPASFDTQSEPLAYIPIPESAATPASVSAYSRERVVQVLLAAGILGVGVFLFRQMRPSSSAPSAPPESSDMQSRTDHPSSAPQPQAPAEDSTEPSPPAAAAPEAPVAEWIFEGRVHDILSFRPVARAALTFTAEDGSQSVSANAGQDGNFHVRLPALHSGGYRLVVDHPDYAEDQFDDPAVAYGRMSLEQRARLRSKLPEKVSWTAKSGHLRRIVWLFPLSPDR
ncbi:MAG: carboxypeptidase-like regulatory domain-containing protein [Elusimicrobiota bacterium]